MSSTKIHPRYAHADGHTTVAFSADGRYIITGGNDGLTRLFHTSKEERDSDAFTIEHHYEGVTHIATHGKYFATCSEDGTVALFDVTTKSFDKLITRCIFPVRHAAFSPNGEQIAIASDELEFKLVNVQEITKHAVVKGHKKSTKWVSYHPNGKTLITSGCEGSVAVWDLHATEPRCIKMLDDLLLPAEPEDPELGTVAWHPDGKSFAFSKGKELHLAADGTWVTRLFSGEHSGNITTVSWSPNGNFLATTATDKQLIIWNTAKKEPVARQNHLNRITGIAWHPQGNMLAYVDCLGQFMCWDNPIPETSGHPAQGVEILQNKSTSPNLPAGNNQITNARQQRPLDETMTDDEHEESDYGDLDDFVEDDDGAGYVADKLKQAATSLNSRPMTFDRLGVHNTLCQNTFQPGSTPSRVSRRYLAFNMIGVIYTIDQLTHSTVTVEFFDKSSHRDFHFTDHYNYTMGCLGTRGSLFAVEGSSGTEVPKPSTIFYRPFESWASKSDWMVTMEKGEDVKAIALCNKGAIVATSRDHLRFFSYSGVQTHIFSLARPIVTLVGNRDLVFVAYHGSNPFEGSQSLEYTLYDVEGHNILQRSMLPITRKSILTWAGFSESNLPLTYDSEGMLRMLSRQRHENQARWVPVLDTRQYALEHKKQETYWPVGLTDDQFMCVICKGEEKYPYFPKPMISDLDLCIPLLHMETQTGKMEERFMRKSLFTEHEKAEAIVNEETDDLEMEFARKCTEMDKILLQLIQAACKADKIQRALDLTTFLHLPKSVDAASKIAVFHHNPALAERMNLVKETKFSRPQQVQIQMDSDRQDFGHIRSAYSLPDSSPRRTPASSKSGGSVFLKDVSDEENEVPLRTRRSIPVDPKNGSNSKGESNLQSRKKHNGGPCANPFASVPTPPALVSKSNSFFDAVGNIKNNTNGKKDVGSTKAVTVTEEGKKRKAQSTLLNFAYKGVGETKKVKSVLVAETSEATDETERQEALAEVAEVEEEDKENGDELN